MSPNKWSPLWDAQKCETPRMNLSYMLLYMQNKHAHTHTTRIQHDPAIFPLWCLWQSTKQPKKKKNIKNVPAKLPRCNVSRITQQTNPCALEPICPGVSKKYCWIAVKLFPSQNANTTWGWIEKHRAIIVDKWGLKPLKKIEEIAIRFNSSWTIDASCHCCPAWNVNRSAFLRAACQV